MKMREANHPCFCRRLGRNFLRNKASRPPPPPSPEAMAALKRCTVQDALIFVEAARLVLSQTKSGSLSRAAIEETTKQVEQNLRDGFSLL